MRRWIRKAWAVPLALALVGRVDAQQAVRDPAVQMVAHGELGAAPRLADGTLMPVVHTFVVFEGQVLLVAVLGTGFQPSVWLYNDDRQRPEQLVRPMTREEMRPGPLPPNVSYSLGRSGVDPAAVACFAYPVTVSDTVRVLISSSDGRTGGQYDVFATVVDRDPFGSEMNGVRGTIRRNQSVGGRPNSCDPQRRRGVPFQAWLFEGVAAESLVVEATAPTYSAVTEIQDSAATTLSRSEAARAGGAATLVQRLPYAGRYRILVYSARRGGERPGPYQLVVR